MKSNNTNDPDTVINAVNNYNDPLVNKEDGVFVNSKKSILKENALKNVNDLPAPFYDELHFANYE